MKNILKITILFVLLTLVLLTTVSCKNILGDLPLFGDNGDTEGTTPESTTPPHSHAFGAWTITQNATCTEKGTQERTCSCGEKETQEINALGHTEVVDSAVAPTCTTDGLSAGSHCSTCGEVFTAQETVPATHDWMQTALLESATCFTQGKEHRACRVCGAEEDVTIESLKHNFVIDKAYGIGICEYCNATEYNGNIYVLFTESRNWFDAKTCCENLGGHLATITSEEEQAFIASYMKALHTTTAFAYAWLGGYRDGNNWYWVTGEAFEYTNWNAGEPNNTSGIEWIVHIFPGADYEWNDTNPEMKSAYLCEFECEE